MSWLEPICSDTSARLRGRAPRGRERRLGIGLVLLALLGAWSTPALASPESELAFARGVAHFGEGELSSAREEFQAVLREEPRNASALHYLGLIAAQEQDVEGAIGYFEQVVAIEPDDVEARLDLVAQLLKAGRNDDALDHCERVLRQEPDSGLALLYQGIALYRIGAYEEALTSLDAAGERDPELSAEVHYYVGLSQANLGDASAAAAAFATAASGAPQHPLGRSASSLRRQAAHADRRWSAAATVGFEYNDNVRLSPDETEVADQPGSAKSGAFVARLQGQLEAFQWESLTWRVGYDGYLQLYTSEDDQDFGVQQSSPRDLSQQTHVAWTNASYDFDALSVALRYDFSYTALDLTDDFRNIHRVAPTIYVPVSDWGLAVGFYQFLLYDYDADISNKDAFDRSGPQHSIGAQQFVFLPAPFRYVVVGGLLTNFDSDGTEFRHNGVEVSFGGEVDLPWEIQLAALYRYAYRNYTKPTAVTSTLEPDKKREDDQHEISFSLDRTFARQINVSLAGSYSKNESNVDNFDIDRFIIGAYVRYAF